MLEVIKKHAIAGEFDTAKQMLENYKETSADTNELEGFSIYGVYVKEAIEEGRARDIAKLYKYAVDNYEVD